MDFKMNNILKVVFVNILGELFLNLKKWFALWFFHNKSSL